MIENEPDVLKFIIVGEASVGKTSIVLRYLSGAIGNESEPTVGAACSKKEVIHNGKTYVLDIWDTAGQEVYRNLVPMYFRGATIAVVVFDLTSAQSFNSVDYWVSSVHENVKDDICILLAANKCDLPRTIDQDDVSAKAEELGLNYFETSATTGTGIQTLFSYAIEQASKLSNVKVEEQLIPSQNSSGCGC